MKAYLRDDLIEEGVYPACSDTLPNDEWEELDFEVLDTPEFETVEGFNMLIKHPLNNKLLFVCSIDFNYRHL